jgi:hypothetical protein
MPYYIYRIVEPRKLQHLDTKAKFRDAKTTVRGLREQQEENDGATIRMIFAKTTAEAEKLLSAPKDDRIIGEE